MSWRCHRPHRQKQRQVPHHLRSLGLQVGWRWWLLGHHPLQLLQVLLHQPYQAMLVLLGCLQLLLQHPHQPGVEWLTQLHKSFKGLFNSKLLLNLHKRILGLQQNEVKYLVPVFFTATAFEWKNGGEVNCSESSMKIPTLHSLPAVTGKVQPVLHHRGPSNRFSRKPRNQCSQTLFKLHL